MPACRWGNVQRWTSLALTRVYDELPDRTGGQSELEPMPAGYVFVINFSLGSQEKWKLPGAHNKNGESPPETAMRGLLADANLEAKAERFRYINKWPHGHGDDTRNIVEWLKRPPGTHWHILFAIDMERRYVEERMHSRHLENREEALGFCTLEKLKFLMGGGMFLRKQFKQLVACNMIPPLGR